MCILTILCKSEEYVYVKHASVWNMMNEGMSLFRSQCYENDDYVKGVLTCTNKHTLNEIMKLMYLKWGLFGWYSSWVEMKCLDLPTIPIVWKREILGWTLFVSWDEVFSSNRTISEDLSKIGWRMYTLRQLRCGVQ